MRAQAIKIEIPKQYESQLEDLKAQEAADVQSQLAQESWSAESSEEDSAMSFAVESSEEPQESATPESSQHFLLESVEAATAAAEAFTGELPADHGLVSGQVVDKETGGAVAGVAIILEGTDVGTITDAEGRYSIGPAPAGIYTLSFIKSGYIEANITEFSIEGDEVSVFPFALPPRPAEMSDEVYALQDFTVTAEAANDLMVKFELSANSAATLSVMTAEDFSKYAASDIGDAVKRVSGVSIEGGKYAVIRGLGDRYVVTTMNGLPIASPDPDRLAVQLDMFPTSLFSSVEVTKTFTPDQPGSSTGAINLVVNPIPEEFFLKASISAGFNSIAHGNGDFLTNSRGNSKDRWALGADDRGFPGGDAAGPFPDIFGKTLTTNQALANMLPSIFITQADFDAGIDTLTEISESVGLGKHAYGEEPEPNHGFKVSFGDVYDIGKTGMKFGYTAGVNYSRKSEFIEDASYFRSYTEPGATTGFTAANFVNPAIATGYKRGLFSQGTTTSTLSGSGSFGLEFSEDHQVNLTVLDLNVSEDSNARLDATGAEGNFGRYYEFPFRDLWDPTFGTPDYDSTGDGIPDTIASLDYQIQEALRYVERSLNRVQLGGSHHFEASGMLFGAVDVDWGLSQDKAIQDEPGYLQTRGIVSNLNGDLTLSTNSTSSADPEPSYLIWREINDEKQSRRIDFTFQEDGASGFESKFKIGILTSTSDRNVFDEYLDLIYSSDVVPASSDDSAPLENFDDLIPSGYAVAADVDLESDSTGKYFMIDQKLFDDFRLIAGYRYEENSADVNVNGQTILRGAGFNNPFDNQPTEGGYDEDAVLPSVTLIWKGLEEKLTVRAAYSQTIALPSAREVSPYASSELGGSGDVEVGNLGLKPADLENWDVGATYTTDAGDSITINLFRKYVENRIERIAGIGSDSSTSDDYGDYDIFAFSQNVGAGVFSWYNNPNVAELNGIELEVRKDLGFTGLNGFSVGANYTYIDGAVNRFPVEVAAKSEAGILNDADALNSYRERQLTGQPSEIFSSDLTYENDDWGLRVSLIAYYVSDVLKGTSLVNSYDVYDKAYTALDLTLSKRINDNFKFGFSAKNLTDSDRGTFYESVENAGSGLNFGEIDRDSYNKGITFSMSFSYEY
ncbi:MAG: TonB-dependent receptor domain-containing protein [Opitutaceae bacterium]